MSEQGDQGERGDSGQRGVAGERGPKGDHGQAGDIGPPGPPGKVVHDEKRERRRDRKALYQAATLLALPVAVIALGPSLFGLWRLSNEIDTNVQERLETTYRLCVVGKNTRDELRSLLILARDNPTRRERTDAEQIERAAFFERALKQIPPLVCIPPGGKPAVTTTDP